MKIAHFIKRNILGFILGIIVTGILGTVALNINSSEVGYSNSNTDKTNVADAITELYSRIGDGSSDYIVDSFTNDTGATANIKVTIGFRPKQLVAYRTGKQIVLIYDERMSTTTYIRTSNTPVYDSAYKIQVANVGQTIQSIDDDGFTIRTGSGYTWNYIAIG